MFSASNTRRLIVRTHSVVEVRSCGLSAPQCSVVLDRFGEVGKQQLLTVQWVRICRLWFEPARDTQVAPRELLNHPCDVSVLFTSCVFLLS